MSRSFSLLDINESDEAQILWINEGISSWTGSADLYDNRDHLVTINHRVKIGNPTSHAMVKQYSFVSQKEEFVNSLLVADLLHMYAVN